MTMRRPRRSVAPLGVVVARITGRESPQAAYPCPAAADRPAGVHQPGRRGDHLPARQCRRPRPECVVERVHDRQLRRGARVRAVRGPDRRDMGHQTTGVGSPVGHGGRHAHGPRPVGGVSRTVASDACPGGVVGHRAGLLHDAVRPHRSPDHSESRVHDCVGRDHGLRVLLPADGVRPPPPSPPGHWDRTDRDPAEPWASPAAPRWRGSSGRVFRCSV